IGLSLLGQRHIKNSEGTRAGLPLARWGFWLCLVTGLGYVAYSYVTGLALTSQANAFLLEETPDGGFLPRLMNGGQDPVQLGTAFLLTLPSTYRKGVTAEDERGLVLVHDQSKGEDPGRLSSFRQHFLVRAFGPGVADQVSVQPLGVQDWGYEQKS